jgi:hypothetical protein
VKELKLPKNKDGAKEIANFKNEVEKGEEQREREREREREFIAFFFIFECHR